MWSALSSVFSLLGPVIFWGLKQWMRTREKNEQMEKSYYAFLTAVDMSGQVKVANHISAVQALKAEQDRLIAEHEKEKGNEDS